MSPTLARACALLFASALIPASPAHAQEGADGDRGLQIVTEAERRDSGWGDEQFRITMTLRNAHGGESTRQLRARALEVEGDGDKTLVYFEEPRDVEGTTFLTYTHKAGDDDQWLYLPALRRVKRIASSNKSGPFMGSEFAYEDLASQEIEKYTYRFLAEEVIDGVAAYAVERVPVYRQSGYSRQVVWYDTAEYRPLRIDYYDRKGELLKRLTYGDYALHEGSFWRAARWDMANLQNGKTTVVVWGERRFRAGLTERDFEPAALSRGW